MTTHRQKMPIGRAEPEGFGKQIRKNMTLQNRKLLQWLFVGPFLWVHVVHGQGTTDTAWTSAAATGNGDVETKTNDTSFFGLTSGSSSSVPPNLRPFQLVLPRAHLLGDWDGLRPKLEERGFTPSLTLVTDIAGNVTGGKSQGVTEAGNLGLNLFFDLEKLAGLSGGSFLVSMSQRWGTSLSQEHVGNVFTIQQVYGGQTFHLIDVAYEQMLLDDRVTFRLGRIAAGDDFLVSPYNWLFMQNAFDGNPVGIFFNSPGMTAYPNATWGALVKVKPTQRTYIMGGVYNGDPSIRDNSDHGADLSMNGPVFAIGEAGYQRNGLPEDTGLIGNYRIGFWYDNSVFTDYETVGFGTAPQTKRGNWGVYALADQVLVAFGDRSRNSGLGICGSVLVSPDESVSQMPYFFTAGIIARGFFSSRPADMAGFGIAYGNFSCDLRHAQEREQLFDPTIGAQDHESVLEWTYRAYFRKSAIFFQPDVQYVINPGGTGRIHDALVLGCQIGINF
jgi:porin